MGYLVIAIVAALLLWLLIVLIGHNLGARSSSQEVEQVDIIEGGSIVEQQKYGRERWRRAEVEIPTRPLSYEEEFNLRSILESGNENVTITTPPLPPPMDGGRILEIKGARTMNEYPYFWRVKTRLPERKGQHCKVLVRGKRNSCLVEFEDGYKVVTSRWYVRKNVSRT